MNDLTVDDVEALEERGLQIEPVHDPAVKSLYGILKREAIGKLRVYLAASLSSQNDPRRRLTFAPSEIAELTVADDVVLPWNAPQEVHVGDLKTRLVGLSLHRRTWLREYMESPECAV